MSDLTCVFVVDGRAACTFLVHNPHAVLLAHTTLLVFTENSVATGLDLRDGAAIMRFCTTMKSLLSPKQV